MTRMMGTVMMLASPAPCTALLGVVGTVGDAVVGESVGTVGDAVVGAGVGTVGEADVGDALVGEALVGDADGTVGDALVGEWLVGDADGSVGEGVASAGCAPRSATATAAATTSTAATQKTLRISFVGLPIQFCDAAPRGGPHITRANRFGSPGSKPPSTRAKTRRRARPPPSRRPAARNSPTRCGAGRARRSGNRAPTNPRGLRG